MQLISHSLSATTNDHHGAALVPSMPLQYQADASGQLFVKKGDQAAAIAGAAKVMEAEYFTSINIHAPLEPMNALVKGAYGQLLNYFHASLKLDHKERKDGKVRRIYGPAQTPLARVLASAEVSQATKQRLLQEKARLNPFALKQAVTRSLKAISVMRRQGD